MNSETGSGLLLAPSRQKQITQEDFVLAFQKQEKRKQQNKINQKKHRDAQKEKIVRYAALQNQLASV
jgi:hypothetical protein